MYDSILYRAWNIDKINFMLGLDFKPQAASHTSFTQGLYVLINYYLHKFGCCSNVRSAREVTAIPGSSVQSTCHVSFFYFTLAWVASLE